MKGQVRSVDSGVSMCNSPVVGDTSVSVRNHVAAAQPAQLSSTLETA